MNKVFTALLFFIIAPAQLHSQIFPEEGSTLNYRIIGVSFPSSRQANTYTIQIATGDYNSANAFKKNIILSIKSKANKIIAEVPFFGQQYTWRVVENGTKKQEWPLHHFATMINERVDTTKARLRILQPATQYKNDYVAVDGGGVLYDMTGRPVWFIPDTNGMGGYVADLQFTQAGTITFLYTNGYEINYNGDILWKSPNTGKISGDTTRHESYHHEFTKLSNGHYMVLGMQMLMCKIVSVNDSDYISVSQDKNSKAEQDGYRRGRFGTLIEYDQKGNIVWSWKSLPYLLGSDFINFDPADSNIRFDPHENAFYFDEKNKCIYLGYRNLNRIIKIEYPSGKVLSVYGAAFKSRQEIQRPVPTPGLEPEPESIFCNQHSIGLTQEGYMYVFNNNSCHNLAELPTVMILHESKPGKNDLEKIWEYTCTVEGDYLKIFSSGGNAVELADGSFFVNMGTQYSKLFIVNREKKMLWSALPERLMMPDNKWTPLHEYRANIITRKDLERMIWSAEIKK